MATHEQHRPHQPDQDRSQPLGSAVQLRANSKLTSSEYCMPVPGVIFLRQASNRYDAALAAIQADQEVGRMPKRPLIQADYKRRRAPMGAAELAEKHLPRKTPKAQQRRGSAMKQR